MFNNAPVWRANGTIAPSRFVKADTSGDHLVLQADGGSSSKGAEVVGISSEAMKRAPGLTGSDVAVAAEQGDPLRVYTIGDTPMLKLGSGGCTAGQPLKSDASGQGVVATAGTDNIGAIALEAGAAGALVKVQIVPAGWLT